MADAGPILVTLDSSDTAERVIPYATALALGLNRELALLTVVEPLPDAVDSDARREAVRLGHEHFRGYLEHARQRIAPGIAVHTHIRDGDPADEILDAIDDLGAEFIALSTHGRSGLTRWRYGSVAGQLLQGSRVPMLVVGPQISQRDSVEFKHLMLPLDSARISESTIPLVRRIAESTGARVSLVQVIGTAAEMYPYALPDAWLPRVDQDWEAEAKKYLDVRRRDLPGIPVTTSVLHGPASDALLTFASGEDVHLVVMATRARTGIARAVLGSVADRMLQGPVPVLLVRPGD